MKNIELWICCASLITTAFATGHSDAPTVSPQVCRECRLQAELAWARSIDRLTTADGSHRLAAKDDFLMLRSPR